MSFNSSKLFWSLFIYGILLSFFVLLPPQSTLYSLSPSQLDHSYYLDKPFNLFYSKPVLQNNTNRIVFVAGPHPHQHNNNEVGNEEIINGQLGRGDSRDSYGKYYDEYTIQVSRTQSILIELTSHRFDTYLIYTSPSGRQYENDDISDSVDDTNSRLQINENITGEATIIVSSYAQNETGPYQLRLVQSHRTNSGDYTTNPNEYTANPNDDGWNESMYVRYTWQSFQNYQPANQSINSNNIDYELFNAALFYETNRQRSLNGLPSLQFQLGCRQAAQLHAQDMVDYNFFDHVNPYVASHRSLSQRVELFNVEWFGIAENIAYGTQGGTYNEVAAYFLNNWMNSPGHRANILNSSYTHMGTGAVNKATSGLNFYCVQVFAKTH